MLCRPPPVAPRQVRESLYDGRGEAWQMAPVAGGASVTSPMRCGSALAAAGREAAIALVQPNVLVCLEVTAAQALLWLRCRVSHLPAAHLWCWRVVLATVHCLAFPQTDEGDCEEAVEEFVAVSRNSAGL